MNCCMNVSYNQIIIFLIISDKWSSFQANEGLFENVTPKKNIQKTPILWHFTAINDMRRCLLDLNFCNSVSQCQLDIV